MFLMLVFLALAVSSHAEFQEDWVVQWDGSGYDDHGLEVLTDASGDIYVLGKSHNGSDYDYVVLKYDCDTHALLWERVYDRGSDDTPRDMCVYGGAVYVTGESYAGSDYDYLTLKLDGSDGSVDWAKVYDRGYGDDEGWGVAAYGSYVYVTGESRRLLNDDATTIRYDASDGSRDWTEHYNGGANDYGTAIALDDYGYVFVAGGTGRTATGMNFLTIMYNSAGTELWAKYKDGPGAVENDPDLAWDIAVYGDDVYVTGQMNGVSSDLDYGTICYRRSDGLEEWCETYDGAAGDNDVARAIVVSGGYVWVTGGSRNSSVMNQSCITTVKYTRAGGYVCEDIHCSGMSNADETGRDIELGGSGDVWVAGRLLNPSHDYDYSLTQIEYDCGETWAGTHDGGYGDDDAYGVAVDGDVVYITGESRSSGDYDIVTVAYTEAPMVQEIMADEPAGGEHWYVETTHAITWTSANVSDVAIDYTTDWSAPTPTWHEIVASTPSGGSYDWEVPLSADDSDDCRIRVSDAVDGDPSDVTNGSFEIYRFELTRDAFRFNNTTPWTAIRATSRTAPSRSTGSS
jgi:hypothetical protein